jgi:hypothetical protein
MALLTLALLTLVWQQGRCSSCVQYVMAATLPRGLGGSAVDAVQQLVLFHKSGERSPWQSYDEGANS